MNSVTVGLAHLFRQLTVGVYVIGVAHGSRRDAFTAASVLQVSYSPLLILVGVNPDHAAYRLLCGGSAFAVSVLKADQLAVARHFGTPTDARADKLAGRAWHPGRDGAPILDHALAYFECETVGDWPAGDHRIVLGEAYDGGFIDACASPFSMRQRATWTGAARCIPSTFRPLCCHRVADRRSSGRKVSGLVRRDFRHLRVRFETGR